MEKEALMNSKMLIQKDVVSRKVQNEEVILNLVSGQYFGLDEVGTLVWNLVKKGKTLKQIIDVVVQNYDVSAQKAKSDITKLVKEFKKNKLIKV